MNTRFVEPKQAAEQTDNAPDIQAEIDAADTDEQPEAETPEAPEPSDVEARARRMGWHSKEEMEAGGRDVSKYVSAEEFIARGENEMPLLKERNRKLDTKVARMERQLDEGNRLLRDLVASQTERTKKEVEKAINALKAERREAISNGDVQRAEELSDEIDTQQKELAKPAPKVEQSNDNKTAVPQEVIDWVEENTWFNEDPVMRAAATAFYGNAKGSEAEKLKATRAEIVRRFPEKFGNPRRSQPPAVEGGTGHRPRTNAKGWNDIPAEDRQIAERLIRQGAVKDKAAYVKDYFGQSAA